MDAEERFLNHKINIGPESTIFRVGLRIIRIGTCDVFTALFLVVCLAVAGVFAARYYWSTKTATVTIEEPLTITNFPTSIRTRPGQNQTLDITIENSATVNYTVTLSLSVNDTAYQTSYITFSNQTYTVNPGTNNLIAWMITDKKAPTANLILTAQFTRW